MSATSTISVQALPQLFETISLPSTTFIEAPAQVNLKSALASLATSAQANAPVLIVAADDVAEEAFVQAGAKALSMQEIPGALNNPANTPCVTTTQKLALAVINTYGPAVNWLRDARVLDPNEVDILIEDLKVSGLKPGRLKEMLKFFYKSIADGHADEPYWLINTEEQQLFAIMEENLEARRALLPCEVSNQALRLLNSLTDEASKTLTAMIPENLVIIADDFGSNGVQSQNLLAQMAKGGLVAITTDSCGTNAQETYPSFEHASALKETADRVLTLEAPEATRQTQTYHYANPYEEFTSVVQRVKEALSEGDQSILIAVPNTVWAKHIDGMLKDEGITADFDLGGAKVKGDPRNPERCQALREAALAKLRQNPEDFTALRSWIGLGDWLVRSDAFLELMAYAREHDMSVAEALKTLAAMPDEERGTKFFAKFDSALQELQSLLAQPESEEASSTVKSANTAITGATVVIAPYHRCHGRHSDITIITGAIDGFLPKNDAIDDNETIDHKKKAITRDQALFDDIIATASKKVIATSFGEDRLENAEALKMATTRIIMRDEKHYARLNPSRFIKTLTTA